MTGEYDVIVIGGGITGAGIARDCAMRGFKTVLLERQDFSSGTSGASMGMLHGGVRYMATDPTVTRLSCLESGIIQRLIPHIIFRIPYLGVVFRSSDLGLEAYAKVIAQYDKFGQLKNSKPHMVLTGDQARLLEPSLSPNVDGAVVYDEPGVNPFQLVIANVLSAAEHGAEVRNYAQVTQILRDGSKVYGVRILDRLSGEESTLSAVCVVNATGPWTPNVAALAGIRFRLRPTKGTHIVFDRRITTTAVSGSGVTLLPHENTSICGLTDDFFHMDPDDARVDRDEVQYLLSALEKAIPAIRQARIIRSYTGVRPLLDQPGTDERTLSRHHQVYDHEVLDGVRGFLTIAGGKMVTYRAMAQDLTDLLCRKLGSHARCRTAEEPLPGGERVVSPAKLAKQYGIPQHTAARLVCRHGARAEQVLEESSPYPYRISHVCECEPVTEAEIRYAIRHTFARTLDDLRRRVRLGTGPCQGFHCTSIAAGILGDERSESALQTHRQVLDFLEERWKGRVACLTGAQLRQEELHRATYLAVGGYHELESEAVVPW